MKVLVVHGSKRGGTAGLAEMVGTAFRRLGWAAEVRPAADPGPVDADVVVIGGALYANRWHRDARRFARSHRKALADVPVWLFSSGPLDDSARTGDLAAVSQVQAIAADLEANGHMTFGGRLEPGASGFFAHAMAKKYAGDWRDEQQVTEWVHEISRSLRPAEIVLPRQRTEEPVPERTPAPR
jgi:menaquinone-dependent protoporphyrinogen oxidase